MEPAVRDRGLRLGPVCAAGSAPPLSSAPTAQAGWYRVTNEQFLSYDRCPRQFLYRFGLEMGQELSPNPSLQARGLVKRTLKELAPSGRYDLLGDTFTRGWDAAKLPKPIDDPQLWAQSSAAAYAGATYLYRISDSGGSFAEVSATVHGVSVALPWGLATNEAGGLRLHCVDFYPNSGGYRDRQDRILGQLMQLTSTTDSRIRAATLYDITHQTSREVHPQRVTDWSVISTLANGLAAGKFTQATSNFPCARCAYSYICPSLPSV